MSISTREFDNLLSRSEYIEAPANLSSCHSKGSLFRTRSDRFNVAIDSISKVARFIKGASTGLSVLWPLRGSMELLITVLDDLRTSKKNRDTWVDLLEHLYWQINNVVKQAENLRRNDELDCTIDKFGRSLQKVIKEMEHAAIDQKKPFKIFFLSRSISDQIQAVASKLDTACNTLQMDLLMQIQSYTHETHESRHLETKSAIKSHRDEDEAQHAKLYRAIQEHRDEDYLRHAQICEAISNKGSFPSQLPSESNRDGDGVSTNTPDPIEQPKPHISGLLDTISDPPRTGIIPDTSKEEDGYNVLVNNSDAMESGIRQDRPQTEGQSRAGDVRTGGVAVAFLATNGGRVTGSNNTFTIHGAHVTYAEVHGIGSEVGVNNNIVNIYTTV